MKKNSVKNFGWFSKEITAEFFGIRVRQFDAKYRSLVPPHAIRSEGGKSSIQTRALVDVLVAAAVKEAKAEAGGSTDPLLTGGGDGEESPGLERYRLARAAIAEMELARLQRVMVSVAELRPALNAFSSSLRSYGESQQRLHGPEAADAFNDALAEGLRAMDDFFATAASNPAGEAPKPAAGEVGDGV